MRFQAVMALALTALLAGCGGGGWLGPKSKPPDTADTGELITKRIGPGLVSRCPVPVAYDDATTKHIQEALDGLPKDNVLRKVMQDYEVERDNLRMCQ
jgi:predicted small lipoprotein YifL